MGKPDDLPPISEPGWLSGQAASPAGSPTAMSAGGGSGSGGGGGDNGDGDGDSPADIIPGGDLDAHEELGGHLIERHVGWSEEELSDRLDDQPNIPAASTFPDQEAAEAAVAETLQAREDEIENWLEGDGPQLVLRHELEENVGTVLERDADEPYESDKVVLVLRRTEELDEGYRVHTGYPDRL